MKDHSESGTWEHSFRCVSGFVSFVFLSIIISTGKLSTLPTYTVQYDNCSIDSGMYITVFRIHFASNIPLFNLLLN